MRAIIIEEERFAEICELMSFEAEKIANRMTDAERLNCPSDAWRAAVADIHRSMHYNFVRWAQSHGASCVKK